MLEWILVAFYTIFYTLASRLCLLMQAIYATFELFAGLRSVEYKGELTSLINVFFNNSAISYIYWGMAAIGIVLCFAFAMVAVVRKMFDYEDKVQTTLGSIVGNMIKSILMIFMVNFIMAAVLNSTNVLLKQVSNAFATGSNYAQEVDLQPVVFTEEDYATMARIYNIIGNYAINTSYDSRMNINSCFNDIRKELLSLDQKEIFKYEYKWNDNGDIPENWQSVLVPIARAVSLEKDIPIDEYNSKLMQSMLHAMEVLQSGRSFTPLSSYKPPTPTNNMSDGLDLGAVVMMTGTMSAAEIPKYNENPTIVDTLRGPYITGERDYFNYEDFYYDFDLSEVDYIVIILVALMLGYQFIFIAMNAVSRIFNVILLYLAAPPIIAASPLDGGGKMKQWTTAFVIQNLSIVGTLMAMRLVTFFIPIIYDDSLILFPILGADDPATPTVRLIFVVAIGFTANKASGMLTGILSDSAGMASTTAANANENARRDAKDFLDTFKKKENPNDKDNKQDNKANSGEKDKGSGDKGGSKDDDKQKNLSNLSNKTGDDGKGDNKGDDKGDGKGDGKDEGKQNNLGNNLDKDKGNNQGDTKDSTPENKNDIKDDDVDSLFDDNNSTENADTDAIADNLGINDNDDGDLFEDAGNESKDDVPGIQNKNTDDKENDTGDGEQNQTNQNTDTNQKTDDSKPQTNNNDVADNKTEGASKPTQPGSTGTGGAGSTPTNNNQVSNGKPSETSGSKSTPQTPPGTSSTGSTQPGASGTGSTGSTQPSAPGTGDANTQQNNNGVGENSDNGDQNTLESGNMDNIPENMPGVDDDDNQTNNNQLDNNGDDVQPEEPEDTGDTPINYNDNEEDNGNEVEGQNSNEQDQNENGDEGGTPQQNLNAVDGNNDTVNENPTQTSNSGNDSSGGTSNPTNMNNTGGQKSSASSSGGATKTQSNMNNTGGQKSSTSSSGGATSNPTNMNNTDGGSNTSTQNSTTSSSGGTSTQPNMNFGNENNDTMEPNLNATVDGDTSNQSNMNFGNENNDTVDQDSTISNSDGDSMTQTNQFGAGEGIDANPVNDVKTDDIETDINNDSFEYDIHNMSGLDGINKAENLGDVGAMGEKEPIKTPPKNNRNSNN